MREFIGDRISIDGRMIQYKLVTVCDYLETKHEMDEKQIEKFCEEKYEVYKLINQIMALKQSCFLLRRVSYSCGSLSEDLYELKNRLIRELREKYKFEFDDKFVEDYGF
jgi:hypothetical protein